MKRVLMPTDMAADYLRVSKHWMELRRKANQRPQWIQYAKNGTCYYDKKELDAFIADCTAEVA